MTLIITLLFTLLVSNIFAQSDSLFHWVLSPNSSGSIILKEDLGSSSDGNFYFVKKEETLEFDETGNILAKVPIGMSKRINAPLEGVRWGINDSEKRLMLVDLKNVRELPLPYDEIKHLSGTFFSGSYTGVDSIFVFNVEDSTLHLSFKKDYKYMSIKAGKNYILINDVRKDWSLIYDKFGRKTGEVNSNHIKIVSDEKGIFKISDKRTRKPIIINENGQVIFKLWNRKDYFLEAIDIGKGIKLDFFESKPIYLDYEGTYLLDSVESSTKHPNVKIIDNCGESSMGLKFEKQDQFTDCKYWEIKILTKDTKQVDDDIILAKENGITDFYSFDGRLLFSSKDLKAVRYLKNNYFLVAKLGKCGIVDSDGNISVPFNYSQGNKSINSACWGGSYRYKGIDYFIIVNDIGHAFIYREENEIVSFTDDYYANKLDGIAEYLVLSKNSINPLVGMVSLKNGALILPFEYYHIYSNDSRQNDAREYAILVKGWNSMEYSLYHISSRKMLLSGYSSMYFLNRDLVVCEKNNKLGIIRLAR